MVFILGRKWLGSLRSSFTLWSVSHQSNSLILIDVVIKGIVAWPVAKLLELVLGPHHGIIYRRAGMSLDIDRDADGTYRAQSSKN